MLASDAAIGDRVRAPDGTEVVILHAWAVCLGCWRAFIGEDDMGRRHHFEVHRLRSLSGSPTVAAPTPGIGDQDKEDGRG